MRSVKHEVVAQEWRQRILSQRESGLSVKKWCASQDIREQKYYYWLHVLRREELALKKPTGGFAELRLERNTANGDTPLATGICAVISGQGPDAGSPQWRRYTHAGTGDARFGDRARMNVPSDAKIYVACSYTDMRKQIDGLAQLVEQSFQLNPFDNAFFLFCGKRCDRMKALYWEGDGFLLLYKRLDTRGRYRSGCFAHSISLSCW